jgi:hypothetical protein
MKLLTSLAVLVTAFGGSALAKECRMPEGLPGMRVQLPPECKDSVRTGRLERERPESLKANQGFIDMGNGTQVRIGGRVRAEFMGRR